MIAALISNLVRSKDSDVKSVADFMPADTPRFDPVDETWENFRRLARASHGKH